MISAYNNINKSLTLKYIYEQDSMTLDMGNNNIAEFTVSLIYTFIENELCALIVNNLVPWAYSH